MSDIKKRNNVYIGNRYVPVFANPVEWDNLREYEPLTIVTYHGTSYTSKKTVPVGTELGNREYWVVTGNYNAQVEAYRQEVEGLSEDVTALNNRVGGVEEDVSVNATNIASNTASIASNTARIEALEEEVNPNDIYLMVSDSYGHPIGNTAGDNNTFFDYCRNYLGRTTDTFRTMAKDGVGFLKSYNGTFRTYFNSWVGTMTAEDKNRVTKVFVVAGRNDYEYTTDEILNEIGNFVTDAKTALPNCEVYLMFVANGSNIGNGTKAQQKNVYYAYQRCAKVGATYLSGGEAILRKFSLMASDHIHPNSEGQKMLGIYVTQAIKNGRCSVSYQNVTTTLSRVPAGITNNFNLSSKIDDNNCVLNLSSVGAVGFSTAQSIGTSSDIVIGFYDTERNFFVPEGTTYIPASLTFMNGNTATIAQGCLYIDTDNSVHIRGYAPVATSVTSVTVIANGNICRPAIEM